MSGGYFVSSADGSPSTVASTIVASDASASDARAAGTTCTPCPGSIPAAATISSIDLGTAGSISIGDLQGG